MGVGKLGSPTSVEFPKSHPVPGETPLTIDLSGEVVKIIVPQKGWEVYSNGSSKSALGERKESLHESGVEIGIILDNALIPYFLSLNKGCSNNTAKYEAVITGLELPLKILVGDLITLQL